MDKEILNEKMGTLGKKTAQKFPPTPKIFAERHVFTISSSFLNHQTAFGINLNGR
jgi:hypothetical protein